MLATTQMRDPFFMYLEPSRTVKKQPMTLMSNSLRNSATVVSKNGVVLMMPAAVTSASRPPNAASTSLNARATDASSATSTSMATPFWPAVERAPARLRSRQATRQPWDCSSRAAAAPMPLAAPVTAARRAVVLLAEIVLIDRPRGQCSAAQPSRYSCGLREARTDLNCARRSVHVVVDLD